MTTVKFDKSVKYAGIRYDAHTAFEVCDKDVDKLKEAGAVVICKTPDTSTPALETVDPGVVNADRGNEKSDNNVADLKEELLSYSVAELTQFAKDRNIDLQKKTRKADIYNIIVAAL